MKDKTTTNLIQTNELPSISIQLRRGSADFIVEDISISCTGYTTEECKESLDYTISRLEDIPEMRERKTK